jgi:hypothetical protein
MLRIELKDLDWGEITRNSSTEDLEYAMFKIKQRLAQRPKRKALITCRCGQPDTDGVG